MKSSSISFCVFFLFLLTLCIFFYRFEVYNLQFKSDGSMRRLSIDGPNIGDWYAVAFISWTDPNNDRIEQQGKAHHRHLLPKNHFFASIISPIELTKAMNDLPNHHDRRNSVYQHFVKDVAILLLITVPIHRVYLFIHNIIHCFNLMELPCQHLE